MIFLLELYLQNRKAKIDAWRKRGKEWVAEQQSSSNGYSYYSFQDYERKFRKPVFPWGVVLGAGFPILFSGAIVAFIIGWVVMHPKPVDPNNPHDCTTVVKKGDKVGVISGGFDGSKGVIIDQRDDCSVNLTLTESTNTFELCVKTHNEGYCDDAKENGAILNVDTSRNIVKL